MLFLKKELYKQFFDILTYN